MDNLAAKLRWGTAQRLEFIEFRLFWDGELNRGEIVEKFGVSVPQASNDLSLYQQQAPGNLQYDASRKCYVPTLNFVPRFLTPNADRYLVQLKAIADRVIGLGDTWIVEPPDADAMPIPARRVEPRMLKFFLEAIRGHRSIHIHYHSMNDSRPDALWRWVTPHAFGFDGLRWHVRGFCHLDRAFKDFILSRCLEVREQGEPAAKPEDDNQWSTFFEVELAPNPKLSAAQQKTIALDYGMKCGRMTVSVRYALLYYFNKRLRLDVAEKQDRPKETPIIVANRREFEKALKRVVT